MFQQRPIILKFVEQFGKVTNRLARGRKRNLSTYLVIHGITLTASVKTNDRKIIGNSFQYYMGNTLSNTGKEKDIRLLHDILYLIVTHSTMPNTLISNTITLCQ